jgi:hypothetical protein
MLPLNITLDLYKICISKHATVTVIKYMGISLLCTHFLLQTINDLLITQFVWFSNQPINVQFIV